MQHLSISSQHHKLCPHPRYCCDYFFLKNCTSCSCFCAAARVLKVPRFLLLPVFGFFLREYKRYCPDFSFLIMSLPPLMKPRIEILLTCRGPPQYPNASASDALFLFSDDGFRLRKRRAVRADAKHGND